MTDDDDDFYPDGSPKWTRNGERIHPLPGNLNGMPKLTEDDWAEGKFNLDYLYRYLLTPEQIEEQRAKHPEIDLNRTATFRDIIDVMRISGVLA